MTMFLFYLIKCLPLLPTSFLLSCNPSFLIFFLFILSLSVYLSHFRHIPSSLKAFILPTISHLHSRSIQLSCINYKSLLQNYLFIMLSDYFNILLLTLFFLTLFFLTLLFLTYLFLALLFLTLLFLTLLFLTQLFSS